MQAFCRQIKNGVKILKNYVILLKFDGKFLKVNLVIYSSASISVPNMKSLAQIPFETSCIQDFQILFSKRHNSEKGNDSVMRRNTGLLFFHEESVNEISKP